MRKMRKEALDWLEEAKADLRHARQALKIGSYNWACFAAEQAAEKSIKAFLIGRLGKRPVHTHDLTALCKQTQRKLKLPVVVSNHLAELSAYYTVARYPNSGLNRPSVAIGATQAKNAIKTARGVVTNVKSELGQRS